MSEPITTIPPGVPVYRLDLPSDFGEGFVYIKRSDNAPRPIVLPAPGTEGRDISRHNGLFDMEAAKDGGAEFIIIRTTMGAPSKTQSGIDDRWRHNREKARAAGIADGVYHFFTPDADPQEQAANLEREIQGDFGVLPVVVDVERRRNANSGVPEPITKVDFTARLKTFLDLLESRYGHKPLIYTSKIEWEAMTILPAWESDYGFFVAQYAPALTAVRSQWRVVAWQYSTTNNTLDRIRWLGPSAPPPAARHNFAPRTNQETINLFHAAAGQAQYIDWIARAGLNSILTPNTRKAAFSGPDIEALPLTDAEKAALVRVLG